MTKEEFEQQIKDCISELHPTIAEGWRNMCLGALAVLVTAKRGKYRDDPALQQTVYEHLDHAFGHAENAHDYMRQDDMLCGNCMDDDGLPHMHHAAARIALAEARLIVVGGK